MRSAHSIRLAAALLVSSMTMATVKAQDTILVASGARIRVHIDPPGEYREGTLLRFDRDSLVFRACAECHVEAAPRAAIAQLDIFRGGSGSRGTHVLIGAGTGLATGVFVGSRSHGSSANCTGGSCDAVDKVNAVGFGFIGLVLGSVAGGLFPAAQWDRVIPRSLSFVPLGTRSVGVELSLSLW